MNAEFRDHMATGGSIDIAVDRIAVAAGEEPIRVDLADKAMRRLLEHTVLVGEAAGSAILLNR